MSGRPRKLALWHTQNFMPLVNHENDLLPIMEILGFHAKLMAAKMYPTTTTTSSTTTTTPMTPWIVYTCVKKQRSWKAIVEEEQLPNPKLPYPRIDGLHPSTYEDFLNNVNVYLNMDDISDLFHVRYLSSIMPLVIYGEDKEIDASAESFLHAIISLTLGFVIWGMNMLQSDLGVKWHPIEGDIRLQNYFYKDGTETKVLCGNNSNNQNSDGDGDDDKENNSIRSRGRVLPLMEVQPLKDIITILSHAER